MQPVAHYLDEFPELRGTGASIAVSNKVLFDLYLGTGMFNYTIVEDRSQRFLLSPLFFLNYYSFVSYVLISLFLRKRLPPPPPPAPLTGRNAPDPEPPRPCPTDSARKVVTIDLVADGGVFANARQGLPGASQAEVIASVQVFFFFFFFSLSLFLSPLG